MFDQSAEFDVREAKSAVRAAQQAPEGEKVEHLIKAIEALTKALER